jgi:hypothetical protein
MTTPDNGPRWGSHGLKRLAVNFVGQEHVGIFGSLLIRLARFLGGDPSLQVAVTSTGIGNTQTLPDNTPALSAVLTVAGSAINYRMDGAPPTVNDPLIPLGSIITITGVPSLKGFTFASNTSTAAQLLGAMYD